MTTTLTSRLLKSEGNLFQTIKVWTVAAAEKGIKIIKLSIGQPSGPALESACKAAAEAVTSTSETMHEYQDNGSPGVPEFARQFVSYHVSQGFPLMSKNVDYLPVPGLKSMLGLIPLACGASKNRTISVSTTTNPGYPTPAYWCNILPGIAHRAIRLSPENSFLFNTNSVEMPSRDGLIMMNYPHNPSGKGTNGNWLRRVCRFAADNKIRIFNDAAYAILKHEPNHRNLADIAVEFPNLSWAEGFSASKAIRNGTGWRVGAIVGSPDFVADIARIKGDADSGFVAFAAAGVLHAFANDFISIVNNCLMYERRLKVLVSNLKGLGMQLAVKPEAGFFTLWLTPKKAFGQDVNDAEHFNRLMIEKTGVVGVHFNPDYIRYAVTSDVEEMMPDICEAFIQANVSY